MRRLILSALVLVLSASIADAGPLLDRWRSRRGGGCQSCPQSQYTLPQTAPGMVYTLPGCANGQCPIPQAIPAPVLPAAVPGK